jgi:hypothetical protein
VKSLADITGSYRRTDQPICYFEVKQDGERWACVVKLRGERFEQTTWQPSPWPTLERLIGEALDSGSRDVEPAKFDMNRKLAKPAMKPTPPRRRGSLPPGSVPTWTPPET